MMWKWTALVVYLVVCVFDFVIVPIWFGLNRPSPDGYIDTLSTISDPMVQMEYLKLVQFKLVGQHDPFTLQGGGLFHLSFGALLTGASFGGRK